jgi:uncharacterized protein with von Willebrand factor type A (vWA) domain
MDEGAMGGGGNPDASQDKELINSIIQEMLGPVFEAIASRLKDLEEGLGETKDLEMKLAQGLIGAADGHKRSMLTDEISSKYGKDIEPIEGFHKEMYGKGFTDSLLDELMGEGGPADEERGGWLENKIKEAKGKYGKYVGIPAEEKVKVATLGPKGEASESGALKEAEAGLSEEKSGEEEEKTGDKEEKEGEESKGEEDEEKGEEEEEEGSAEEGDAISKLMKEMSSLTGAKHKLSEPVAPKKSKAPVRR